ncbi:hypothetical protein Ancab_014216 [Ancistrocladus abbreviatus]
MNTVILRGHDEISRLFYYAINQQLIAILEAPCLYWPYIHAVDMTLVVNTILEDAGRSYYHYADDNEQHKLRKVKNGLLESCEVLKILRYIPQNMPWYDLKLISMIKSYSLSL